jgi:hypothetical protein
MKQNNADIVRREITLADMPALSDAQKAELGFW